MENEILFNIFHSQIFELTFTRLRPDISLIVVVTLGRCILWHIHANYPWNFCQKSKNFITISQIIYVHENINTHWYTVQYGIDFADSRAHSDYKSSRSHPLCRHIDRSYYYMTCPLIQLRDMSMLSNGEKINILSCEVHCYRYKHVQFSVMSDWGLIEKCSMPIIIFDILRLSSRYFGEMFFNNIVLIDENFGWCSIGDCQ